MTWVVLTLVTALMEYPRVPQLVRLVLLSLLLLKVMLFYPDRYKPARSLPRGFRNWFNLLVLEFWLRRFAFRLVQDDLLIRRRARSLFTVALYLLFQRLIDPLMVRLGKKAWLEEEKDQPSASGPVWTTSTPICMAANQVCWIKILQDGGNSDELRFFLKHPLKTFDPEARREAFRALIRLRKRPEPHKLPWGGTEGEAVQLLIRANQIVQDSIQRAPLVGRGSYFFPTLTGNSCGLYKPTYEERQRFAGDQQKLYKAIFDWFRLVEDQLLADLELVGADPAVGFLACRLLLTDRVEAQALAFAGKPIPKPQINSNWFY